MAQFRATPLGSHLSQLDDDRLCGTVGSVHGLADRDIGGRSAGYGWPEVGGPLPPTRSVLLDCEQGRVIHGRDSLLESNSFCSSFSPSFFLLEIRRNLSDMDSTRSSSNVALTRKRERERGRGGERLASRAV